MEIGAGRTGRTCRALRAGVSRWPGSSPAAAARRKFRPLFFAGSKAPAYLGSIADGKSMIAPGPAVYYSAPWGPRQKILMGLIILGSVCTDDRRGRRRRQGFGELSRQARLVREDVKLQQLGLQVAT